jgi:tetratricopeptide (TPR) repeat protein
MTSENMLGTRASKFMLAVPMAASLRDQLRRHRRRRRAPIASALGRQANCAPLSVASSIYSRTVTHRPASTKLRRESTVGGRFRVGPVSGGNQSVQAKNAIGNFSSARLALSSRSSLAGSGVRRLNWRLLFTLSALWCTVGHAQSLSGVIAQVDARAEVAAALYAASATQAAAERVADANLRAQRTEIERLRAQLRTGAVAITKLRVALVAAQEEYVTALAASDRAFAQEIGVFRRAVEDIAATPEGAKALSQFNAGDELGALAILDRLRQARDTARKRRADIESAAEGRRIARLALEARAKGKLSTLDVIVRYEEVIHLDPGAHWDWVELSRLYVEAGKLVDAARAAEAAADHATNDRDRSVALMEIGSVLEEQGDRQGAMASYKEALAIAERLAKKPFDMDALRDRGIAHDRMGNVLDADGDRRGALTNYLAALAIAVLLSTADPGDMEWQRDVAIAESKVGMVLEAQGDTPGALARYRRAHAITERLAKADPGNLERQRDLSSSHGQLGEALQAQGEAPGALANYQASLAIAERLATTDPDNMEWQLNLIARLLQLDNVTEGRTYAARALELALEMKRRGILAPRDEWMLEELKRRTGR